MKSARIIYIADIFCPWCYGFGPIIKRISSEHPELPVTVLGGDLVSPPFDLNEAASSEPGLAEFWKEAQETTGRSFAGALAALEEKRDVLVDSVGADRLFTALKELSPEDELEKFLLLEDMFYAQGENIFGQTALEQLSRRWNVDLKELQDAVKSQKIAIQTDATIRRGNELLADAGGYPAIFLQRGEKMAPVSSGFAKYAVVAKLFENALGDNASEPGTTQHCSARGDCKFGYRKKS